MSAAANMANQPKCSPASSGDLLTRAQAATCPLDAMATSPALIRTATWDVVAWNRAAAVVLNDYGAMAPEDRNVLRMMFLNPDVRAAQPDWESVGRFVVGAFRADAARAGATARVEAMVAELSRLSPEFALMWREHDVRGHGEGVKRLNLPHLGEIAFEYSTFTVEGRPDLSLAVYNPVFPQEAARIQALIAAR
jgi:hypothetical protein